MFLSPVKIGVKFYTTCNSFADTEKFVRKMITSDKVVIFSKSYCRYSLLAKKTFNKLKQPYTAIELDQRNDQEDIKSVLDKLTGAKTVPRVFINGKFIGGGTDVANLYKSGKLQNYLN